MSTRSLLVSEIFGPTFQGEGRQVGRRCGFLRLGTCNLHCTWCDTPYTWVFDTRHGQMHHSGTVYNPKLEMERMDTEDVADRLGALEVDLVIISGGEPMLQQAGISDLMRELRVFEYEIETAGTIPLTRDLESLAVYGSRIVRFNVSPKLSHSGNEKELRYKPEVLQRLATRFTSIFKFVVDPARWEDDFAEISEIAKDCQIRPSQIYIMPLGTTAEEQLSGMADLAEPVLAWGWNLTPRLHTLIWGNERGR